MAFAYLNPQSAPWRRLGVHYLLAPADLPPELSLTVEEEGMPSAGRAPVSRGGGQIPSRPRRGEQGGGLPPRATAPTAPTASSAPSAPSAPSARPSSRASASASAPPSRPVPAAGATEEAWRPLAPALWPAPWQERLARTRPGQVAWTYWQLGGDLCHAQQAGRSERGAFFRRILQDLGHPQGTHTFWPVCLPDADGEARANADVFWSGLQALRSRGVIIMGSAAARAAALPGRLEPLTHRMFRGRLVWILRDVDNMLGDEARYAQMLAFLRNALHILSPR